MNKLWLFCLLLLVLLIYFVWTQSDCAGTVWTFVSEANKPQRCA